MNIKGFILLLLASCASSAIADDAGQLLENAISGKQRSEAHKLRDPYRHPLATLTFFDVQPDMRVVEIWPGAEGWYTEILAPYLRDKGKLYAAHFSTGTDNPFFKNSVDTFIDKLHQHPEIYDKVEITVLQPPLQFNIAPEASVDRVLTFRNVHNWMRDNQADAVFSAMFKALKPGGILGVVEHRNNADIPQDPEATSGYVSESHVIALAEKAGFKLLAKSEINANGKDTKDYPEGVWTLPPALRLEEKDRAKYLAIGESDRMTMKFIKPR